jgi:IS5 family transposase
VLQQSYKLNDLFNQFNQYLTYKSFQARKGQIVNVSFVEAPRQRNTKAQNEPLKEGLISEELQDNPRVDAPKDMDAH